MSFTSVIDASDSSSISAIEGIIVCSSVTGNDNIFRFPRCSCMALCSVALESEAMVWASLYFLYSLFSSSDIGVGLFPTIASYSFCCSSSFYENNNKIRNNKDIELDKKKIDIWRWSQLFEFEVAYKTLWRLSLLWLLLTLFEVFDNAQFNIWTGFSLILALLHKTPILKRHCKDHKPKQLLNLVRKGRNCTWLEKWPKMRLNSKMCNDIDNIRIS